MARPQVVSLVIAALSLAEAALSVPGCADIESDPGGRRQVDRVGYAAAGGEAGVPAAEALESPIALDGGDAEVWTWQKKVTGTCSCGDDRANVLLRVNDTEVEAERRGERFSAVVPLDEGENRIVAHCRSADGTEYSSEAITFSQRLKHRPTARIRIFLTVNGILLAEATARDPWYFTNGFDAAYDWTDELGRWSMEHAFDLPDEIGPRLREALTNAGRGFDEDALVFHFLNNNDTGERFITRHGRAMEMVAAGMLLTLPGLPCIYTGQEVGAEFRPYRTRGPVSWDDRYNLRDYYKRLIRLRRQHPSLYSRQWEMLRVEPERQVLAYARYGGPEDAPVLVVLNFSREPIRAQVTLTERSACFARTSDPLDLLLDERVHIGRSGQSAIRVPIPGLSVRILVASKR
ncbi:MAG: DUF3459 domain-containing protein [Armatimonadota bacterium]|nr:MAG: DUF3459 domain-containing protein [Armatimonadota bacterium]